MGLIARAFICMFVCARACLLVRTRVHMHEFVLYYLLRNLFALSSLPSLTLRLSRFRPPSHSPISSLPLNHSPSFLVLLLFLYLHASRLINLSRLFNCLVMMSMSISFSSSSSSSSPSSSSSSFPPQDGG